MEITQRIEAASVDANYLSRRKDKLKEEGFDRTE
jgi:hypothetical protein